ncbi:MAG: hypothetical protein J6T68_02010 [Candidatus Methanomethylophilaceae archaeon]|nr:hypothetical protein [Candidatus Methanomethylophilaceae archaeon]
MNTSEGSNGKGASSKRREVRLGRGFSGSQGLLAAAVMAVFAITATVLTEECVSDIDMAMLLEHSRTTEVFTQMVFGIGGALLILFGLLMVWTNRSIYVMFAGALYVAAGLLLILASFYTFETVSQDYMWVNAFADIMVGAVLYMGFAASGKHGLTAGAMMIAIIGIAGATLAGSMTVSFGLMAASVVAIFITAVGEICGIE